MPSTPLDLLLNNELQGFMQLRLEEITASCRDANIQQELLRQFNNIDSLILFTRNTTLEKLKVVLVPIMPALAKKLLHSPEIVAKFLNDLDVWNCEIICQIMKRCFKDIILSAVAFSSLLRPLNPVLRPLVFETMQDYLPDLIKGMESFNEILCYLEMKQRLQIVKAIEPRISGMFHRELDVLALFKFLSAESIKDSLPGIITSSLDFKQFMKYEHNLGERAQFFDAMKHKLPDLNKYRSSFENIFEFLDVTQRAQAFEIMEDGIPDRIQGWSDLFKVLKYLDPSQSRILLRKMRGRLPGIVNEASKSIIGLPESLEFEQFKVIIEEMKDSLIGSFRDIADVKCMFNKLSPEQLLFAFAAVKERLPWLFENFNLYYVFNQFSDILKKLSPEQGLLFLETIKDCLPWPLVDAALLKKLFVYHFEDANQRLFILDALQDVLPQLIPCQELHQFITTYFPDDLQKQKVKQLYFASLLCELQDKFTDGEILECGLFEDSWFPGIVSFTQLEGKLKGKDAIIQGEFKQLYFVEYQTKKITQIDIKNGKQSDVNHLRKKFTDSYTLADPEALKLIASLMGRNTINEEDKKTANALYDALSEAARLYFSQAPSINNDHIFQVSCTQAMNHARNKLSEPQVWKEILAIIALTIVSLGIVPVILSVANKINTGSWYFRLFKTENERKLDEIAVQLNFASSGT